MSLPPLRPDQTGALIGHTLSRSGVFPKVTHTVTFDYPDCVRTYDGREWTVKLKLDIAYKLLALMGV